MTEPKLHIVKPGELPTETLAERIRGLQAEIKKLAREQVGALSAALIDIERLATEISEGGDAFPPGVRDLARRLVEDCEARVQTLEANVSRTL